MLSGYSGRDRRLSMLPAFRNWVVDERLNEIDSDCFDGMSDEDTTNT
jgi:hypothetical protein